MQSYSGTPGPNGTFDQGGNAQEWTEGDVGVLENRTIRGGNFSSPPEDLGADDVSNLAYDDPWAESVAATHEEGLLRSASVRGSARGARSTPAPR